MEKYICFLQSRCAIRLVLVDAHAHLRGCFDVAAFLEEALSNVVREAQSIDGKSAVTGVLCLVDPPQEQGFERLSRFLAERRREEGADGWSDRPTAEDASLHLRLSQNRGLIVVAGRQVESRERLEVLSIGSRCHVESGIRVDQLIRRIDDAGGVPILPWGVGKWLGVRGRHVRRVIKDPDLPPFCLGDSAHRPSFWPKPSYFRQAEKRGIRNLPGSDPLPFRGEAKRVGSFGLQMGGSLDPERPARDLKRKLLDPSTTVDHFGRRETLFRFLRKQTLMQYRKLVQ